jgi:uncharacterized protein YukE
MAGFEQASAQLVGLGQQQTDLQRAVAAGELWMEADVAERAAQRCEQTIDDIERLLEGAERLIQRRKFGDNVDGRAAAERFGQAGENFIAVMRDAQRVFDNMAMTFRAAGRTAAEADAAAGQMFRGRSE